jgi:hypothetical protein
MKVIFTYDRKEDIWCLLNRGAGSTNSNSPFPTEAYKKLISQYGEKPNEEDTSKFIDQYLLDKSIDIQEVVERYQKDFDQVSEVFQKRAEKIFGLELKKDITAYLTVNNRCPYDIEGNLFFVSVPANSSTRIAMHELWHFYTWYKFGSVWQGKLGNQKYNDIKEALTVLLNVECKDLLPEGVLDNGYPQHKELREEILRIWNGEKDIEKLWDRVAHN